MKIKFLINNQLKKDEVEINTNESLEYAWQEMKSALLTNNETITLINAQNDRQTTVYIKDIVLIQSEDRMCNVVMNNQEMYLLNMRIKHIENELNLNKIIRINNTTMINIDYIEEFSSKEHSRIEVTLKNKDSYLVSRYYIKNFRRILK